MSEINICTNTITDFALISKKEGEVIYRTPFHKDEYGYGSPDSHGYCIEEEMKKRCKRCKNELCIRSGKEN